MRESRMGVEDSQVERGMVDREAYAEDGVRGGGGEEEEEEDGRGGGRTVMDSGCRG